jgi:hypothetical protein
MSRSHYFYFRLSLTQLEEVIALRQTEFDQILDDSFTEDELMEYEKLIDSIAAVYVQPILSELTFDDFYASSECAEEQEAFFYSCQSSICLENLPYFESNPFQVTYLKELLKGFDQVLIDQGGVHELCFKDDYLEELARHRDMDSLIPKEKTIIEIQTKKPVEPIDFLILDVYKEIHRLQENGKMESLDKSELSPKIINILKALGTNVQDSTLLLKYSGLNAKDFDDGLERLKFWLRKL